MIDLDEEGKGHVVAHEFEVRIFMKMIDVALGSREEVINAKNFMSSRQQPVNQMGTEKTGSAGY